MFKYIKWELKSLMKKYTKVLLVIAILTGLMLVIPLDSNTFAFSLIIFAFTIMTVIIAFSTFVFGTRNVIDTFRKPTFMLESMISFPPYKILLAKYLLAIILNAVCSILFILCLSVLIYKQAGFPEVVEMFKIDINVDTIEALITLLISSTLFTSTITLCYVFSKSLFPKGKGAIILGVFLWYLGVCFLVELFLSFSIDSVMLYNLVEIAIIALCYLASVKLIENKLEIYN